MATSFLVPGPSYHFYGNASNGFDFLGFAERSTSISLVALHQDVNADYGGPMMPADVALMGESALISASLVRYNELVLNRLKARIKQGVPGQGDYGQIGTLLVSEKVCHPYIIVSAYGSKPVFSAANMNAAYYFPQVYAADAIDFELSTGVKIERVFIRSIPQFNAPDGRYWSYSLGLPSGITLPTVL